jgi:benzoate-CoA ligase family protein
MLGDSAIPPVMNAADVFVDANVRAGHGDRIAIVEAVSGRTLSYHDVAAGVNRAGHALERLGVRAEERVMLLLPDSPAFVFTFFGAIKIGAVAVPANTLLRPTDYEYLLNDSRARVLVISRSLVPTIDPIRSGLRHLEHLVIDDTGDLAAWRANESADLAAEPMSKDDAAFWLYSSGTTGFPKGAVHLHHDMVCCARSVGQGVLGMRPTDRTYSVARLFFAYGLGNALYFPFSVGASTILDPNKPDAARAFDVIRRFQPTIFYAVPTAYSAMIAAAESGADCDLRSVRLCSSAGEPLAASLYDRWHARFGVEILDGIGSTEVLHTFISNRPGRVRPGSSGEAVPGYEIRIVDAEGRDVPDGEIGDLLVHGDSICSGYWNKHEQTKRTIQGEWIRTGDKYSRDADGYYWYQGRSDDMLKVSGFWVSPAEVEAALVAHPAVLECAVVGREDHERLVKPIAFAVLKDPAGAGDALADELKAFVKSRLAPYKCPRWIAFVDDLPKTATGKIQRYKLRTAPAPSA